MSEIVAATAPSHVNRSLWSVVQPWVVCFSAALYFFFEFMQVNLFNALGPSLIKAFNINATQLGNLAACYFYANVIFLFPAGILLDRLSTRKIIIVAMVVSIFCAYGISVSHALWQAELLRFITGIAGSFCLLSCVRLASRWFPPKRMALVIGLIVTLAMIGGMMAQTPFTLLTDDFGWRHALFFDAFIGLGMLALIVAFVKDYPSGKKALVVDQHNVLSTLGFWQALKQTVNNLQNWLAGIYASLVNLPIFILGSTWGSLYLVQTHNISRENASLIVSMIFVGMIIGSPVFGWFSDRIALRRLPMIGGAIASLIVILLMMLLHNVPMVVLMILFFALGFAISSQIIAYPLVAESNARALTGTAEGLASVMIMAGGFTVQLFPLLLNWHWKHVVVNNIPIYAMKNYHIAMLIMPVAFIIALLTSFLIRETHAKAFEENAVPDAT